MSILLDHLPTNFDVAFKRALETLNANAENDVAMKKNDGQQDNKHPGMDQHNKEETDKKKQRRRPSMQDKLFESVAEIGIKGTTERSGGEGNVLGQDQNGR
jgi:hypothetical protein